MRRLILLALAAALPACGGKNPDATANQSATESASDYPGGSGLNASPANGGAPASGEEPGATDTMPGVTDGTNGTGSATGGVSGANGTTTATGGTSGTTLESPKGRPAQTADPSFKGGTGKSTR